MHTFPDPGIRHYVIAEKKRMFSSEMAFHGGKGLSLTGGKQLY